MRETPSRGRRPRAGGRAGLPRRRGNGQKQSSVEASGTGRRRQEGGKISAAGGVAMDRLTVSPGAAATVDEYLEYQKNVGEDDGSCSIFTPEESDVFRNKILPLRLRNRLYVSWRSPTGMDCKLVGPQTPCFCTHRYKQHKTEFIVLPADRPISLPCKVSQCPCNSFYYVPSSGTRPIRCKCKHYADQHSADSSRICLACSRCPEFHSNYTCSCGHPAHTHRTVVETREERLALGKPVGRNVPYAAMGEFAGFSALSDDFTDLDENELEFLKSTMNPPDQSSKPGQDSASQDLSNQTSSSRRPGEDDMAYFERHYQERLNKGLGFVPYTERY
ncbi:protein FAM221A [Sminthopsis crassicaudata]|uniref:protein FAM221A n=1 Tax=Sminthopsis crassicaudata TaxID=9301 RepID=UPI003D6920CE